MAENSAPTFDDAEIRERLRKAPRVASPTPRLIRVDRAAYLDAAAEPEEQGELEQATRTLVEKLGGHLRKMEQRSQGLRAGRRVAQPPTVVWYYELPADALDE